MEKKIVQLTEAFEHLRFEQCLRTSDQILKKMEKSDGKKKINLTDQQYRSLYLTRIGSLASIGLLHQANQLIIEKFKQPVISQQTSFLFLQICSLAMDRRIPQFVTAMIQNKQKKNIDVNRFILLTRNFSALSRIFLRKFATSKKNSDSFTQVYLEYLQQLDNHKMISYRRDRIIVEEKKLQFKFVSMFLQKFISNFKASQEPKQRLQKNYHQKTQRAIADLKIKIAIHEGNSGLVRKLLTEYQKQVQTNIFIYLRSLRALTNQKEQNSVYWRQQFLRIFRNNINIDNYEPIYDFSIQFVKSLIVQSGINLTQLSDPVRIKQEQLYLFKSDMKEQVQNYINSLYTDYAILKQKEKEYKNKDFYKISTKNCLLLLINVLDLSNKYDLLRKFLWVYKEQNGKKLTFNEQIIKYFTNPNIFTPQYFQQYRKAPQKLQNTEDKIIWLINYERLYAKNPLKHSLEQNLQQWQRLHNLYLTNLKQVQKQKKLEKGQRYLSDQILTILADSIRKYTEQAKISQLQRQELYYYILGILQQAISKSPHNHDNKLRAIFYYNKLNYYQDVLRLLQSLDIKAVQFQTLGYLYLKNIINFGAWDTNEQLLARMLKSYHQNNRESSQYAYKALLGISFNQCQQNMCYFDNITRSYNLVVLLYTLYMKNKGKQNCKFYLLEILNRIQDNKDKMFSFNADFRTIRNIIDPNGNNFVDFYGIYNNYRVLQTECQIRLLLNSILSADSEESIHQLRKSIVLVQDLKQVYNFSHYEIFDKKLEYKFSGEQVHHQKITGIQFRLNNKINKLILDICDFILSIRKQGNINEQLYNGIHRQIKQLNQFVSGLIWRQQVLFLPTLRFNISEIIAVLGAQVEIYSAKKKKVEGQAQKKQYCQQLIGQLIGCASDGVKIQQRLAVDKKYIRQSMVHRDNLLDRMTKMTNNEYKKLYKLKI